MENCIISYEKTFEAYNRECEPYLKMLYDINCRKTPTVIYNIKTGEFTYQHGIKTLQELEIENHLLLLRYKYFPHYISLK